MAALALAWGGGPAPAAAHSPHPGLDFSIGIDVDGDTDDECGTGVGQPAKCSAPTGDTFRLNVYLNSLGGVPYGGFDIYVEYSGASSKSNPDASPWPDCVIEASVTFIPGVVGWGCVIGPAVPPATPTPSTYTGLIGTTDFNCTADGSVTMVHGGGGFPSYTWTDLLDLDLQEHAEGEKTTETLDINCTPVGGISLDSAVRALPLETAPSAGGSGVPAASTGAGVAAAGVLALAGVAWYGRRRFARDRR